MKEGKGRGRAREVLVGREGLPEEMRFEGRWGGRKGTSNCLGTVGAWRKCAPGIARSPMWLEQVEEQKSGRAESLVWVG